MTFCFVYKLRLFFILFILCLVSTSGENCYAKLFFKNSAKIPDFCQGDKRYGILPEQGKPYCGPTAVSNLLIYLDKNGFVKILETDRPDNQDQFKLIQLLGSAKYMNTKINSGTEPLDLMKGLEKYIREKEYDISIKWKGWTNGSRYFIGKIPDKDWIINETVQRSNLVLHLGWYKFDPDKNFYKRIGGHFVTVAGIKGTDGWQKLIIHDPAIRSGIKPKNEFCDLVPLDSGTLSEWDKYSPRSAKGYLKLEGIKIKEDADLAIIDGALAFKLFLKN